MLSFPTRFSKTCEPALIWVPLDQTARHRKDLSRFLPEQERLRAERALSKEVQETRLATATVLYSCLYQLEADKDQALKISRPDQKKPFLPNSPWKFNLSHTVGLAALIITHNREAGLDLEQVDLQRNHLAIATRHFTQAEQNWLGQQSPSELPQAFTNLWTRKEAVLKAQGQGLLAGLNFTALNSEVQLHTQKFRLQQVLPPKPYSDYLCHVASSHHLVITSQWMVDWQAKTLLEL